jgi:hypothetical protein
MEENNTQKILKMRNVYKKDRPKKRYKMRRSSVHSEIRKPKKKNKIFKMKKRDSDSNVFENIPNTVFGKKLKDQDGVINYYDAFNDRIDSKQINQINFPLINSPIANSDLVSNLT